MVAPKVFVSSTCYDLSIIRSELRSFIEGYGFEPVMSDYSDILYDPRDHVHKSCLKEIPNCDMGILIIGGRYGGIAIPESIELIDVKRVREKGIPLELQKDKKFSVTQTEFLKCIEVGIPVFSFVSSDVMSDHRTWEKNIDNNIADKIIFPSIGSQEPAKYIFEFIDNIGHLNEGNSITPFSNLDDIKTHLRKQWAGLFQRFLSEQHSKVSVNKEISNLSEQIADLKTAIVTSISDKELRDTAKGAIKYRQLINFLSSIYRKEEKFQELIEKDVEWTTILKNLDVDAIVEISNLQSKRNYGIILVLKDSTFFQTRYSIERIDEFMRIWDEFRKVRNPSKSAIIDAILESINGAINLEYIVYDDENFFDIIASKPIEQNVMEITIHWQTQDFVEKSKKFH